MIEVRNVKNLDEVYWAERDHYDNNGVSWGVKSGYYLASYYDTDESLIHIVTLGNITSCVVRHLKEVYETKKEAWASIADKETE